MTEADDAGDAGDVGPDPYLVERVRTSLAEDPRVGELGIDVVIDGSRLVLTGEVGTAERREAVALVAGELAPGHEVDNRVTLAALSAAGDTDGRMIRVAALGDPHAGVDSAGLLRPALEDVADRADVLLVAGDLTRHGEPEEAAVLAEELRDLGVPVMAVLGNHDHHADRPELVRKVMEEAGVVMLEGESTAFDVAGTTVGVVGAKGFGGGFAGACATEFGEPELKAFVRHTRDIADRLGDALAALQADVRLVVLHFSPVEETLVGERLEIWPFLGSYLLGEAIDRSGADLIVHGHAHGGSERGTTPAGVPVRNVAQPVIGAAYRVYCIGGPGQPACGD